MDVFLRLNGLELDADKREAVATIQAVAAGRLTEDALSEWVANDVREPGN